MLRRYTAMRTTLHMRPCPTSSLSLSRADRSIMALLRRWFLAVCHTVGIWPTDGGRRPSLRALRHSFAVQRLQRWYQEGKDVQALLPHLSVYLGHVRPQESYWYLTATSRTP